jgi:GxxExxY protein
VIFSHPDLVSIDQTNQKKPEKSDKINDLIQLLLRSSIEIHTKYGNTLSEKQYQKLLTLKFDEQKIPYQKEVQIKIEENGVYIGSKYIDLVLDNMLAVELKAVNNFYANKNTFAQLRKYMELTDIEHGMIINFGKTKIESHRLDLNYEFHESDQGS